MLTIVTVNYLNKKRKLRKMKIQLESNNEQMADTMSKSGFDLYTALFELVDNSIAGGARKVDLQLTCSNSNKRALKEISITDDGHGIAFDIVKKALAMGATKNKSINEHGVGMKNAIAFFGNHSINKGLIEIATFDGKDAYRLTDYKVNELTHSAIPTPKDTFCTIRIDASAKGFTLYQSTTKIIDRLGQRYADHIDEGVEIVVSEIDETTHTEISCETVVPKRPPYWNEENKTATPLLQENIVTPNIEATFTLGKTAKGHKCSLYSPATNKGGIDMIQDNRIVAARTWLPLTAWRPTTHPTYNAMVGRLVITKGHLDTTPKKDGFQVTPELEEVREHVARIIGAANMARWFEPPTKEVEFTEANIRDSLKVLLESQTQPTGDKMWSEVKAEQSTDTNLNMDITAESGGVKYVFEIKKKTFNAQDMNQLIGYMVATGCDQGIVFADRVLADAHGQLAHWKQYLGIKINVQFWESSHPYHEQVMAMVKA